jgi:hypothetical protein
MTLVIGASVRMPPSTRRSFGRELDHTCRAGPTRILETKNESYAELRGHAAEPLTDLVAMMGRGTTS